MVQHCLLELTDKEDEEDRKQLGKKLVEDIEALFSLTLCPNL